MNPEELRLSRLHQADSKGINISNLGLRRQRRGEKWGETLPKLSFFSLEKQYSENMKIIKINILAKLKRM